MGGSGCIGGTLTSGRDWSNESRCWKTGETGSGWSDVEKGLIGGEGQGKFPVNGPGGGAGVGYDKGGVAGQGLG